VRAPHTEGDASADLWLPSRRGKTNRSISPSREIDVRGRVKRFSRTSGGRLRGRIGHMWIHGRTRLMRKGVHHECQTITAGACGARLRSGPDHPRLGHDSTAHSFVDGRLPRVPAGVGACPQPVYPPVGRPSPARNRVDLFLQVRRFFCDAVSCLRQIFAERLPNVAGTFAHKTSRLSESLEWIAFTWRG
jgi:hypothetical protein